MVDLSVEKIEEYCSLQSDFTFPLSCIVQVKPQSLNLQFEANDMVTLLLQIAFRPYLRRLLIKLKSLSKHQAIQASPLHPT